MREELEIRNARPGDAPAISALILSTAPLFASTSSGLVAPWFASSVTPAAITDYIRDSRFNYLVALVERVIVGSISVRDATHVHHLFVAPEFQRQGIAGQLWRRAEADAVAAGNKDGFFVRSSEYAVPVYERFGFRVAGGRVEKEGIVFVPMRLERQRAHD